MEIETNDSVVIETIKDLDTRSIGGTLKYGVNLDRTDLSLKEWLQHAYEETLDKALYLKRAIRSLEEDEVEIQKKYNKFKNKK